MVPAMPREKLGKSMDVFMQHNMVHMQYWNASQRSHRHRHGGEKGNWAAQGIWQGQILDPNTRYVTVDIARAGTLPSQIAFELLNTVVNPQGVRQDHLYMNRATNEAGEVCGINHSGSKIGGDIENAIVLFPDPMGATGASMSDALKIYKKLEGGVPKQLITVHLIVTPEYIRTIQSEHPDTVIYALRLDRAMSSAQALSSAPGKYPEEESGLNEVQYIVPGAGGVGEILNNSFV